MTSNTRKTTTGEPKLSLVVDNLHPTLPALYRSRLGRLHELLKKVRVISNGPYVPRVDREIIALAEHCEKLYWEHVKSRIDEPEALIHLAQVPNSEVLKGAIKRLRERRFNVTPTEIRNRSGMRITLSRRRA